MGITLFPQSYTNYLPWPRVFLRPWLGKECNPWPCLVFFGLDSILADAEDFGFAMIYQL
jgi:hypothetical protein